MGTIAFVAAGFNRVKASKLEREELAKQHRALITAAISRRLAALFESRAGPVLRFLMPLALLAIVYVPLRQALDEVAWQVRVRAAVHDSLTRVEHDIVQSRVRVERHEVDVLVVLLGKTSDADASRARLQAEIRAAADVLPRIEVFAIPDARAFAGLESTLRTPQDPLPVLPVAPILSPAEQLEGARALIRSNVARLWPTLAVGEPLTVEVSTGEVGPLRVRVVHLGAALGQAGIESLSRGLGASIGREVDLLAVAIPEDELSRSNGDLDFVTRVASAVRASAATADVNVCVVQPRLVPKAPRVDPREQELIDTLRATLAQHPRVTTTLGTEWSVRFRRGECDHLGRGDAGVEDQASPD